MSFKALLARRPLSVYFAITLGWICAFTLLAYRFIPPELPNGLGSVPVWLMVLLMFGMPSAIGVILTAIGEGKPGLKALFGRLGQWRVQPQMYLAAVALPVLVFGTSYFLQYCLGGPEPQLRLASLAAGIGSGMFSCLFEELGWRGFVMPRLLRRHTLLTAGLLTGLGWGAWHFMLNYIGMRQYGAWMPLLSLLGGPVELTGFALLMAWVYRRVKGSLLVMVLFHLSITTCAIFLSFPATTLAEALRQHAVTSATTWAAVAIVAALGGYQETTIA